MKTVTISVTQEDIKDGKPESCISCPIALAIDRKLGEAAWSKVFGDKVKLFDELSGSYKQYPLPKEAVSFILAFDNGSVVQPFSFTLELP